MLPTALTHRLAELAEDNQSGASWLIGEAAHAVTTSLAQATEAEVRALFPDLAYVLADCRPSMAPFWNLANGLALATEHAENHDLLRRIAETCAAFADGVPRRLAQVARNGAGLLAEYPRLLTHSMSHSVIATLRHAAETGTLEYVVCMEGAPMCEGRVTAATLASDGLRVAFTTDAGACAVLDEVDAVVVGADAVCTAGLRNKVGTYGLAAAAKDAGLPVFALCDTSKFVPAGYAAALPVSARDPDEVWDRAPGDVAVLNYYFDLTPLGLINGFVTEAHILDAGGVRRALGDLPVARLWATRADA